MEHEEKPRFVTIGGDRFVIVGEFFLKLQPRALMDEGSRMRIARMGGRASHDICPSQEQQPEPVMDMPADVAEAESPQSDDR